MSAFNHLLSREKLFILFYGTPIRYYYGVYWTPASCPDRRHFPTAFLVRSLSPTGIYWYVTDGAGPQPPFSWFVWEGLDEKYHRRSTEYTYRTVFFTETWCEVGVERLDRRIRLLHPVQSSTEKGGRKYRESPGREPSLSLEKPEGVGWWGWKEYKTANYSLQENASRDTPHLKTSCPPMSAST